MPPSAARRIFGVDFSGAMDAGKKTWLAEGYASAAGLVVEDCRPGAALPGSGERRDDCLAALVRFIAGRRDGVFGCDFPFSLPAALIPGTSWAAYVRAFPTRYATAEAFRGDCRSRSGGKEPKRATDRAAGTPWAAFNVKLYRQTFHGLRDVLHPLVEGRSAVILPWHATSDDRPWVLETCPASTLKAEGLYWPYKGRSPERRVARRRILRELVRRGLLAPLRPDIAHVAIENHGGDALDSIVAAVATQGAMANGLVRPVDAVEALEGRVYFEAGKGHARCRTRSSATTPATT